MKILVMGGTRYFGKRLVNLLIEQGNSVTIATSGKTESDFNIRVRHVLIDRKNPDTLKILAHENWDVIYDQICFTPNDALNSCELFAGKVGLYIYTSTIQVYSPNMVMQIESDFNPKTYSFQIDRQVNTLNYSEGKRLAEVVYEQRAAFPVVSVRLPVVLGIDDYTGRLLSYVNRVKSGEPFYIPVQDLGMSMISSFDAARFLAWVSVQSELIGPINACSSGTICLRELGEMIADCSGLVPVYKEVVEIENQYSPLFNLCSLSMNNKYAMDLGYKFEGIYDWLLPTINELLM